MKTKVYFLFVGLVGLFPFQNTTGGPGEVSDLQKIADGVGNLPDSTLDDFDFFGGACVSLGDLDGDGIPDLAVGASGDDFANGGDTGSENGAVYILFLNGDGTIKTRTKIADGFAGLPNGTLPDGSFFGSSCAVLGDLDDDGVVDIAVGASGGVFLKGSVHILFLNSDGTVKTHRELADGEEGIASNTIGTGDHFGISCASAGDLDGDGVPELVVGAYRDDTELGMETGDENGAVHVLFLNADGTVKSHHKIADGLGGLTGGTLAGDDNFGFSCALLGDLNHDGFPEFIVGARGDDTADGGGGSRNGAIYILSLGTDGMVSSQTKIADGENGLTGGTLMNSDNFGASCAPVGDLNWDGVPDLAVGATGDDTIGGSTSGGSPGAVHLLFMNGDGTVKTHSKIADGLNGLTTGTLPGTSVYFGSDSTLLGDLNGDGIVEFAVGADGDDTTNGGGGGSSNGAVFILSLGETPIEVTTEVDEIDDPGTGLSLREAIGGIASGDFRKIVFDPSLDGATITLGGTQIELIDQNAVVSAEGLPKGITISGNDLSRIFRVDLDSSLALEGLTLRNGFSDALTSPQNQGGAIQSRGVLYLLDCWITGNTAPGRGGGIDNLGGELQMDGCTVDDNEANLQGGGGIYDSGTSRLINCTVTNNQTIGEGGGIYHGGTEPITVSHVTVVGNTASVEGGGFVNGGGAPSVLTIRNSIVADNTGNSGRDDLVSLSAPVVALGSNLVGSNEGVEGDFSASALVGTPTDRVSPNLWPLGDFGGKTPTMPPMLSSGALDAGPSVPLPGVDQRDAERTDGMPDLGAVEGAYVPPVVAAVLALPDNSAAKAALSKKIKKLKKKAKISKRKGQKAKAKKLKKKIKKLTKKLRVL